RDAEGQARLAAPDVRSPRRRHVRQHDRTRRRRPRRGAHAGRPARSGRRDLLMDDLLTTLIRGLAQGSFYALVAAGFVVIYRATDVVNFAQPALMVMGAYFTALFTHNYNFPFWL